MAKAGRKAWIPDLARVEELAAQGLTNLQIAACLGICEDTLYTKQRQLTEFSEAIRRGKAKGISQVANALFQAAVKGSVPAAMFFLKSRAGWQDAPPPASEQNFSHYSREALIELIEHELEQLAERRAYQGRAGLAARTYDSNW
jgi:hypothetical protein